ncbi:unnamed protein product [Chondrus crispus]|uniref:Tyrosine specific protein phosphatases domain-containing protein n=1 Tax=Chondrus crispus TaxID=2769 RepID=R7Q6T8_CHOCR|nr:unnamed protein product [Chondrus crispus]CDF33523.1 unnamed protein product [Chondrus crispus]|eukprot:XP_005713326.1 unnamed protein product [Chondrus crispus]
MSRPLPPLIPPFRLCLIEEGVYRGGHPSLKNMRYLRRLKLRTVLSLVPGSTGPSSDLREYCDAEGVTLFWHAVDKYDDGFSHTPQLVASLLNKLVDPRNHPIFIHCRDGGHNTGLVVMCLRRLQNWNLPTIYEEFMRYTKANDITFKEKKFVEAFHAPVLIPLQIPVWLWDGVRHSKHPSVKLELEVDPDASTSKVAGVGVTNVTEKEGFGEQSVVQGKGKAGEMWKRPRQTHKQIEVHVSLKLGALDLTGVGFATCCRPGMDMTDMDGAGDVKSKGAQHKQSERLKG